MSYLQEDEIHTRSHVNEHRKVTNISFPRNIPPAIGNMASLQAAMVLYNIFTFEILLGSEVDNEDMIAVNNLRMLGGAPDTTKKSLTGAFALKFDIHKELIQKVCKNELSNEDYPWYTLCWISNS
ncbi:unnamed protein product [Lupinus luteus]|uniref:Uncharacterized protein n=1 Tax=Lupinus luteus TaxID=3873 RepID=A0AAV1XX87_LUPLU